MSARPSLPSSKQGQNPSSVWAYSLGLDPSWMAATSSEQAALLNQLQRFQVLMRSEAMPVQAARMRADRRYAQDCLAQAHCSANEGLRHLAMALFQAFERLAERPIQH